MDAFFTFLWIVPATLLYGGYYYVYKYGNLLPKKVKKSPIYFHSGLILLPFTSRKGKFF